MQVVFICLISTGIGFKISTKNVLLFQLKIPGIQSHFFCFYKDISIIPGRSGETINRWVHFLPHRKCCFGDLKGCCSESRSWAHGPYHWQKSLGPVRIREQATQSDQVKEFQPSSMSCACERNFKNGWGLFLQIHEKIFLVGMHDTNQLLIVCILWKLWPQSNLYAWVYYAGRPLTLSPFGNLFLNRKSSSWDNNCLKFRVSLPV